LRNQPTKFVKVKCKYCTHLNLIPTPSKIEFKELVRCEHCGKTIIEIDKKSKTIFFYGDTKIP